MLNVLIRVAGSAIAALVALVAGVYAASADLDGLPDAEHIASIRLDDSPLPRDEIISLLDDYAIANAATIDIVRVASAPHDFMNGRVAFRFGEQNASTQEIDWFSPTMHGSLGDSDDLGVTSLNGVYALYGDKDAATSFQKWAHSVLSAEVDFTSKTATSLLTYALLTVGAWVPASAAVLLLGATVLSWYVLRARTRELSVLAGMRLSAIIALDLRSLLSALAGPALAIITVAIAVLLVTGFGRLAFYVTTLATFAGALAVFAVVLALVVGMFALPTVRSMAARRPPERSSWAMSELLKTLAVVVVAAIVPGMATVILTAVTAAGLGAAWASLGDSVSVRIGSASLGTREEIAFGSLVRSGAGQNRVLFSMSLSSDSLNILDRPGKEDLQSLGFDGIVLTNQRFLDVVGRSGVGIVEPSPQLASADSLPPSITRLLIPSLQLWTTTGQLPESELNQLTGGGPFPVFGGMSGTFDTLSNPLVISVDELDQFTDSFLTSALSRGNLVFTDAAEVAAHIEQNDMTPLVLSVDRVADLGLYDAQSKARNAQLGGTAIVIALLALVMSIAVSAWIFALLSRRRWFVQRTAGRTWSGIVLPRLVWEASVAVLFGATMAFASAAMSSFDGWAIVVAPLCYLIASWGLHIWAASTTFRGTLARRG